MGIPGDVSLAETVHHDYDFRYAHTLYSVDYGMLKNNRYRDTLTQITTRQAMNIVGITQIDFVDQFSNRTGPPVNKQSCMVNKNYKSTCVLT